MTNEPIDISSDEPGGDPVQSRRPRPALWWSATSDRRTMTVLARSPANAPDLDRVGDWSSRSPRRCGSRRSGCLAELLATSNRIGGDRSLTRGADRKPGCRDRGPAHPGVPAERGSPPWPCTPTSTGAALSRAWPTVDLRPGRTWSAAESRHRRPTKALTTSSSAPAPGGAPRATGFVSENSDFAKRITKREAWRSSTRRCHGDRS